MRIDTIAALCLSVLLGCGTGKQNDDGGYASSCDLTSMSPLDLAPSLPSCPAARGLSGDSLMCVDFSQIQELSDPRLMGWDFTIGGGSCPGWEVAGGNLQIQNFSMFHTTCGFTLPPIDLNQPQYNQYNSITLALRHHVDLDPGTSMINQAGQVYLGSASSPGLVTQITNTQLEQQMSLTVDKQNLPGPLNNVYQWLLQVQGFQPDSLKQGWQISSIAVMGNR